ncbi:MAG: sigma 54-interacting transcriptional regulator, partial [Blastocatellia bacterium]
MQRDILSSMLILAGRPSTKLDAILQFSLEKALSLTASDIGGLIFLLDAGGQAPIVRASGLRGDWAEPATSLLEKWNAKAANPISTVLASGSHSRVDDYHEETGCFPLFLGGRSSLWVPLLDSKRAVGCLHVESSQPRYYVDTQIQALQSLGKEIVIAIDRLLLREDAEKVGTSLDVVGISPVFLDLERQIRSAARHAGGPVLITGERGTGKALASRAVHYWGTRRDKPFIPVLASALTESLFADELFGHTRHAFTGADQARQGKFKAADGGTLF